MNEEHIQTWDMLIHDILLAVLSGECINSGIKNGVVDGDIME